MGRDDITKAGLKTLKNQIPNLPAGFFDLPSVVEDQRMYINKALNDMEVKLTKVSVTGKTGDTYSNIRYRISFIQRVNNADVPVANALDLWVMSITTDSNLTRDAMAKGLEYFRTSEPTSGTHTEYVPKGECLIFW